MVIIQICISQINIQTSLKQLNQVLKIIQLILLINLKLGILSAHFKLDIQNKIMILTIHIEK